MNYVMETQNLSKKYQNVTVVDHVNLHIPKGKQENLKKKGIRRCFHCGSVG